MKIFFALFLTVFGAGMLFSQTFAGKYNGQINGDNAVLVLEIESSTILKGSMRDSKQTYLIAATYSGNEFAGTASETSLGLTFQISGNLKGDHLYMDLVISLFGVSDVSHIDFVRTGKTPAQTETKTNAAAAQATLNLPNGASRDPKLTGTWIQESNYSSGYGDNAFSGMSMQSIVFYADGSVAEGGSRATISGSNYGGDSGSSEIKKIDGVTWYTKDQHLFLLATDGEKTETLDLGKYYIENGAMLITGQNGQKTLLKKKN